MSATVLNIKPGVTIGPGSNVRVPVQAVPPTPPLVTDGILLNFDAATYTSGDWVDNHASVHAVANGSPAWSSDSGGTFVLTQSPTTYFTVPWPTFYATYTVDIWFNLTGVPGGSALVSDHGDAYINFCVAPVYAGENIAKVRTGWYHTNWEGQYPPTTFPYDGSTWVNVIMAVGPSEYNVYNNGTLDLGPYVFGVDGLSAPDGFGAFSEFFIGRRWDGDVSTDAKIAVVNIYNRALDSTEALQNFNHYKTRFGL